jgi:hypothetical protein
LVCRIIRTYNSARMPKRKASTPIDMNGVESDEDDRVVVKMGEESTPRRTLSDVPTGRLDFTNAPLFENFAEVIQDKMKSLNRSFVASIRVAVEKDPSACLVPLALDYVSHSQKLLVQCQTSSKAKFCPVVEAEELQKLERYMREKKGGGNGGGVGAIMPPPKSVEPLRNGMIQKIQVPSSSSYFTPTTAAGSSNNSKVGDDSSTNKSESAEAPTKSTPTLQLQPFKGFKFGPVEPAASTQSSPMTFGGLKPIGGASATATPSNSTTTMSSSYFGATPSQGGLDTSRTSSSGGAGKTEGIGGAGFQFSFKPQPDAQSLPQKANQDGESEESDEPPKNEFKPVVEDDALYSVR